MAAKIVVGNTTIQVVSRDITTEDVDAVVTLDGTSGILSSHLGFGEAGRGRTSILTAFRRPIAATSRPRDCSTQSRHEFRAATRRHQMTVF